LHREGVSQLCMIGPVKRPSLREIMPDWRAARILARIGFNRIGDDALLQGIRSALEDEGFDFIGVHHVLTDLLTKPGALTKRLPDRTAQADIERALAVARANGALDVGQGAVVQQGVVLAVEAVEGTNAMLERCAALA